jgi:hypothetical protein
VCNGIKVTSVDNVLVRVGNDEIVNNPVWDSEATELTEDVGKAEEVGEVPELSEEVLNSLAVGDPEDVWDIEDNPIDELALEVVLTLPLPGKDGDKVVVRVGDRVESTLPEADSVWVDAIENV